MKKALIAIVLAGALSGCASFDKMTPEQREATAQTAESAATAAGVVGPVFGPVGIIGAGAFAAAMALIVARLRKPKEPTQ